MAKKKIKKEKIDNVGIHSFSKKADIFFSIISGLIALSCILPFVFVIIISVTDEKSLLQYGYSFFPSQIFYHLRPSQYVVQRWFGTRLYHGDPCTSAW